MYTVYLLSVGAALVLCSAGEESSKSDPQTPLLKEMTSSGLLEPLINENNGKDGYKFSFATKDQSRKEEGRFVNGIWTVTGTVSWISPDGVPHRLEYIADDKGYRLITGIPIDLPQASPINVSVLRGLSIGALGSLAG